MAKGGDEERNEEPTAKRKQQAKSEGNVPKSKELSTALSFIASIIFLYYYMPHVIDEIEKVFVEFFQVTNFSLTPSSTHLILTQVLNHILTLLMPFMVMLIIVGILSNIVQFGFLLTPKALQPKISNLSPIKGFSNLFSLKSLVELIKSLIKIFAVGLVAFFVIKSEITRIVSLASSDPIANVVYLGELLFEISIKIAVLILLMAIIDFIYQKWQNNEDMKMTKQEVKEEHKQMEGDPKVKQRIRSMQMDMARKRMMEDVPESDVVVTNPTHYAVAITYEAGKDSAPKVVAKGQRLVALRIKELAKDSGVFIHEDPPLARSLFSSSEIGEEIPENLYRAVAEILAMVYKMKGKDH